MRSLLSTVALFALTASAMPAAASSIDVVGGVDKSRPSIRIVSCHDCPPPIVHERKRAYQVPVLPAGSESAEIIEDGGTRKLKRVENLMGGSPVVFMSSAEGWATRGSTIIASSTAEPNVIDSDTTTAAVVDGRAGTDDLSHATFELKLK